MYAMADDGLCDTILTGDALAVLRTLPDACVQCVVTSPPYFGLRDYGIEGQIGLEPTVEAYVARMVDVFAEVRRVLRRDGTCWLNLGDSYFGDSPTRKTAGEAWSKTWDPTQTRSRGGLRRSGAREGGMKPKDLCMIPARVALALQADGWYLRSDIIWAKPNPMPESVTDRPTKSHEYVFLLSKSERYYYDAESIKEPVTGGAHPRKCGPNSRKYVDRDPAHLRPGVTPKSARPGSGIKANSSFHAAVSDLVPNRNRRSVWTIATRPYSGAHFATFPPALVEPCILAGTSPQACEECGAPWRRMVEKATHFESGSGKAGRTATEVNASGQWAGKQYGTNLKLGPVVSVSTTGWQPGCKCEGNTGAGVSLVLDPFFGAGTVGVVAKRHGRHYLGIELNPEYVAMAEARIAAERQPVLWSAAR